MDDELDDMGIVWGEETVPAEAVESLLDEGLTPDEAIPYALILTKFNRHIQNKEEMRPDDLIVVLSLVEHLVESLTGRVEDEYDDAIADWAEAMQGSLQPSLN
jgi:hypothetical protein